MKPLPSPLTVWETVRHLRPSQVGHQILRRVVRPGPPAPLPLAWKSLPYRFARGKNAARSAFDGRTGFRFNNEERNFAGDWNDPGARKLWLYNLHYMAWIFDIGEGREGWIRRWIRENPPDVGNGWEPYPLSLRLFNWCKHYTLSGRTPDAETLASMALQAAWLLGNLEFHLGANHLLENLLALAYAGFFLEEGDARARAARARIGSLLRRELAAQFLPDGGHYELSPMYHAILLERLLDLLNVWPDPDPYADLGREIRARARAGLDWLDTMSVGGRFALFNDSAYDSAPEASLLLEYGASLLGRVPLRRVPLRSLEASGYYRAESGPCTLIFDAGLLGPDHQMGHAQGDMLSLCLWLRDVPILVHPGNFEYVRGPMRDFCRSTAAHNTLVVEGGEQADWWASHRVGWRGRPHEVSAVAEPAGTVRLRGAHDGFSRLPGRPIHARELLLRSGSLEIRDSLAGPAAPWRAYYHFHPDCILQPHGDALDIRSRGGTLHMQTGGPIRLEDSWYCPEFGLRVPNRAAVVEGRGAAGWARFTWEAAT